YRLDHLAQQLTQSQHDIDDLKASVARDATPPPAASTTPQPVMTEVSVPASTSENPMEVYQAAYRDYQRGNYDLALAGFRDFLARYPESELAANAEYWIGESLYSQKKYSEAIDQFNRGVNAYPASDQAPGPRLTQGYAYVATRDRPRASR